MARPCEREPGRIIDETAMSDSALHDLVTGTVGFLAAEVVKRIALGRAEFEEKLLGLHAQTH